jgi:hypothetical protein
VLDLTVVDRKVRTAIYRRVTRETLREAVERTEARSCRGNDHEFDFLSDRYNHLRQFTPQLLGAFAFQSNRAGAPVLEAVATLRDLNARRQRKVPPGAPVQFVPARWRPHAIRPDGEIDRHYYALCVLWELRAALRAGNVWLQTSRRFADPETYLISRERWPHDRRDVCRLLQLPEDGASQLKRRRAELEEELSRLDRDWPQSDSVRIEQGRLVLNPLSAEVSARPNHPYAPRGCRASEPRLPSKNPAPGGADSESDGVERGLKSLDRRLSLILQRMCWIFGLNSSACQYSPQSRRTSG